MRRGLAVAAACAVLAGCGGGGSAGKGPQPPYTLQSVKHAFITTADLGQGAIEVSDDGHGAHIIYTPPDSIPTCPYVQRADDVTVKVRPAVEVPGANATGRFIVGPGDAAKAPLPVVTQGAVVFKTDALADAGMQQVQAEAAKCPGAFTILGGPPIIVGDFTINKRAFELAGWEGFAQQLVHTYPPDVDPETYDDLVTVVVHKANAIVYVGFEQTKHVGQRADSATKVRDMMNDTLDRLG